MYSKHVLDNVTAPQYVSTCLVRSGGQPVKSTIWWAVLQFAVGKKTQPSTISIVARDANCNSL